jgi:hypothetical protein
MMKKVKELSQAAKHTRSLLSFAQKPASLAVPLVIETKESIPDLPLARPARGQPLHCFLNLVSHSVLSENIR